MVRERVEERAVARDAHACDAGGETLDVGGLAHAGSRLNKEASASWHAGDDASGIGCAGVTGAGRAGTGALLEFGRDVEIAV